jgi:hypothetical protein
MFYSDQDQTAAAVDTDYAVTYTDTVYTSDVYLSDDSKIYVNNSGLYVVAFSALLEQNNSSTATAYFWLRKNGTNVANSTREYTVGSNRKQTAEWVFTIELDIGDYIEMMWEVDDTSLELHYHTATNNHTDTASAMIDVRFVSNV